MTISIAPAGPVQDEPVRYRDEPVGHHGGAYVTPGRRAVTGDWLYPSPELCRNSGPFGLWIGPEDVPGLQVLVCPSCGLDCT